MPSNIAADLNAEAFAFVRSLAGELSSGAVELPSFPDIAMQVRQALDDESVNFDRVARIVGAEAGLASCILLMANSPAMGYGGKPVTDLKAAVTKIGLSNVRSAALAFALGQLRKATLFKHIIPDLEMLWRQSTRAAALCRVLASRTRLNPDLALLAGLLHNIGSVYILARAPAQSGVVSEAAVRDMLLRDWSPSIGRSIAENWGLPEEVVEAIGQQTDMDTTRRGAAGLGDVLGVALCVGDQPPHAPLALARLGLSESAWAEILAASEADIAELRAALSG